MSPSTINRAALLISTAAVFAIGGCGPDASSRDQASQQETANVTADNPTSDAQAPEDKVFKTPDEWKKILTPEQFHITRQSGTERAFTGEYTDTTTPGLYNCVCCSTPLFASETKFHSGCGWPSFFGPLEDANLVEVHDSTHGMVRTEIRCAKCDAHLGHVFNDGPKSVGGLRYCINSAALVLAEQPRPPAPDVGH